MPKEIIVSAIGNRIEYATTNGKGLITGERKDITEQAIDAVFAHLKTEHERHNANGKAYGRTYGEKDEHENRTEYGRLMYLAPGTDIVWKEGGS